MQTILNITATAVLAIGLVYAIATDTRPPRECYQLDGYTTAHHLYGKYQDFYITQAQYDMCASYDFVLDASLVFIKE